MRHLAAAIIGWAALSAQAAPIVIGFEGLDDFSDLGTRYSGVEFLGGVSLVSGAAGGSLNEIDFPPHGGLNVAFWDSALRIDFASSIAQVGAYFTYFGGLRLSAFDVNGVLLGTAFSSYASNAGSGGDAGSQVNEFIGLSLAGDIRSILIESTDPLGGAYVFDDLSFDTTAAVQGLPEPAVGSLAALACLAAGTASRRRRRA